MFLLSICTESYSQPILQKNGAYRNSVDFRNNKPFLENGFRYTRKKNKKIPSLYIVRYGKDEDESIVLDKSVWGIYEYPAFYLNVGRLGMKRGYVKFDTLRKYNYFKGKPILSLNQEARLNNAAKNFGLTGMAVSGTRISKENKSHVHYVLNRESGMINLLTKDYMLGILQPWYLLLKNYESEPDNDTVDIMLLYLELVNRMP